MNKSIVCRFWHSVALKDDGTLECWGSNEYNQCDPVYKTFTGIIDVACGYDHSVALKNDGTLECWGSNLHNQCDPVYKTFTNIKLPYLNYILK